MEEKHIILIFIIIGYIGFVYLLSLLGKTREIGQRRLFMVSLFLTPILGLAFLISSSELKMKIYKEESFKCERCGYVFSDSHTYCPLCEEEGIKRELKPISKIMT